MGFGVAIHFDIVLAVGLAAMNRREPSVTVGFSSVCDCFGMTADVLTDFRISEPVIGFQEDPCSRIILRLPFTSGNESFQRVAVFL
jgi:hypothetical protein